MLTFQIPNLLDDPRVDDFTSLRRAALDLDRLQETHRQREVVDSEIGIVRVIKWKVVTF